MVVPSEGKLVVDMLVSLDQSCRWLSELSMALVATSCHIRKLTIRLPTAALYSTTITWLRGSQAPDWLVNPHYPLLGRLPGVCG